jgi:hypothetical protein
MDEIDETVMAMTNRELAEAIHPDKHWTTDPLQRELMREAARRLANIEGGWVISDEPGN